MDYCKRAAEFEVFAIFHGFSLQPSTIFDIQKNEGMKIRKIFFFLSHE
jgi:hypothetical protein